MALESTTTNSHPVEFVAASEVVVALRAAIARAKGDDALAPVWVVTPSRAAAVTTLSDLAATQSTHGSGVINVRLLTIEHLSQSLLAEHSDHQSRYQGLPHLHTALRRELVRQVAAQAAAPLDVYNAGTLAKSLAPVFEDLRHRPAAEIDRIGEASPLSTEIVRLYEMFRAATNGRYADSDDVMLGAVEAVRSGAAGNVPVVAVVAEPPGAHEAALLGALGDAGRLQVVAVSSGNPELDGLMAIWLWGLGTTEVPSGAARTAVDKICVAPDADAEVQVAIGELIRHAQSGMSFSNMALLYSAQSPYARIVEDQMRLAKIPSRGPGTLKLSQTMAGGFVLRLLDVIDTNFQFDAVAAWLLAYPNEFAGPWLRVARAAHASGDVQNWIGRVAKYAADQPARRDGSDNAVVAPAFAEFLTGFSEWSLQKPTSWESWAGWLQSGIELYLGGHTSRAHWPSSEAQSAVAVEQRIEALAGLDAISGLVDQATFVDTIREELAGHSGLSHNGRRGVFVGTLGEAIGCTFDAVVVCGMAEGLFPRGGQVNGLLASVIVPGEESRSDRDKRIFLLRASGGGHRTITAPAADVRSQRSLRPSSLLLDEASFLAGRIVDAGELMTSVHEWPWLNTLNSFSEIVSRTQLQATDQFDTVSGLHHHVRAGADAAAFDRMDNRSSYQAGLVALRARDSSALSRFDGLVNAAVPLGGEQSEPLRPTQLEQWAVCPFKYLLGSVLGVEGDEPEPDALSMNPRDRGSLVHTVLEQFLIKAPPRTAPEQAWSPSERILLHRITDEQFDIALEHGVTPPGFVTEIERKSLHRHLETLLDDDEAKRIELGVVPVAIEHDFGYARSAATSVTLSNNGTPVRFRGRIDRLDASLDGRRVLVTDYKTGKAANSPPLDKDPVAGGTKLQLSIYAKAAQAMYPDAAVQASYWFVTDEASNYARKGMTYDEPAEERLSEVFEGMSASFANGAFPAVPGDDDGRASFQNCRNCAYDTICVRDRSEAWSRKASDAAVAPYLQATTPREPTGPDNSK